MLIVQLVRAEERAQQKEPRNPDLEEREALILVDLLHKLRLLLERPVVRAGKVELPLVRQTATELGHALDDTGRIAHEGVTLLARRRVERVDNIGLDLSNGVAEFKVLGKVAVALGARGARRARVGRSDAEGPAEENGGATVVDEDYPPEVDAEDALFLGEEALLCRWVRLARGIVVQAELDGEPDKAADEAPERATLTLYMGQIKKIDTK
jgi:hypothetical protein